MIEKNIETLALPPRFIDKLRKDIEYLLAYEEIKIKQIILFGSCARGTYKVTSDIDLLIITSESVDRYIRGDIASMLDEEIDCVRTDVIFYKEEVFLTSSSLIVKKIREEGIIIYSA